MKKKALIILGALAALSVGYAAAITPVDVLPNYQADVRVRVESYLPRRPDPAITVEALATLTYSNGFWRIDSREVNSRGVKSIATCMEIPDGVRFMEEIPGPAAGAALRTLATAWPFGFPPPGQLGMFPAWLALCPKPKLPLLETPSGIHRFLSMPTGHADLLSDPRNVATFRASYLNQSGLFLSELVVTNNGIDIDLQPSPKSGLEAVYKPFPAPYHGGFCDFRYAVLSTTNYQGFVFPLRAEISRFWPNPFSTNPPQLYPSTRCQIEVLVLNPLGSKPAVQYAVPSSVLAQDFRHPGLLAHPGVQYEVTDDQWSAITNPALARLAAHVRLVGPQNR